MICPSSIRELYLKELERHREDSLHPNLNPRRGINNAPSFDLADAKTSQRLLQAWYDFHEQACHKEYEDLYSKVLYCRRLSAADLSPDTFLQLIADRSFLFLEHNENYTNHNYLPLSEVVKNCAIYKEDETAAKNIETVLNQAFVPTKTHAMVYDDWQNNLEELRNAKAQREDQMARLSCSIKPFTLFISAFDGPLSEEEDYLSRLFSAYADALATQAYETLPIQHQHPWDAAIHWVFEYVSKEPGIDPIQRTLVFFHLFTKTARKLAAGTLQRYTFGPVEKRASASEDPSRSQARISRRIRCNIMLFDQLLEFFIPDDCPDKDQYRADAKYIFYLYSRYDRYWHYDLQGLRDSDGSLHINFHCPENPKDGVDHFGNLLRYHIRYCLPSHAQWLIPVLSHNRLEPPLSVLTTLLLAEGAQNIPARSRMTDRVQALLDSKEGAKMLHEYERDMLDLTRTKEHLEEWCRQLPRIPAEAASAYEPGSHKGDIQACRKYILEYSLKDRVIQLARKNLDEIAAQLFGQLCQGECS